MKKIITVLCAAVMALSLFAGCGQKADDNNTAAAGGTVSTDGSTSMEKVIGALGESFMEANSGTTFTYNPTGSGSSPFLSVVPRLIDIIGRTHDTLSVSRRTHDRFHLSLIHI